MSSSDRRLDIDAVPQEPEGQPVRRLQPDLRHPEDPRVYRADDLKLDEIITRTYTLDQVNEGYGDLLAGETCATSWSTSTKDVSMQVVGHRRELEPVRAALSSGARILLEGPPGTGKSTLPGRPQNPGTPSSCWSRAAPS
jgi:hypothetical protein